MAGIQEDATGVLHMRCINITIFNISGLIIAATFVIFIRHILGQLLLRKAHEPPVVFHWLPFIGSTVRYGMDPYKFFFLCRQEYGDIFTFILLGRKTTVYLGTKGNALILNGRLDEVNAEDIYGPLATPVFGTGVVYDCPNSKLMEQKKFVKHGFTTSMLQSYIDLISAETHQYFAQERFTPADGSFEVTSSIAELTVFTASRTLQGKDVRMRMDSSFADLFHDLDKGFVPINPIFPRMPLPLNRRRDRARERMAEVYMQIIRQRRSSGRSSGDEEGDMIWNLMDCVYKDGKPMPDREIANLMIALLMAGQHSSSSTMSWILLQLASRPDIQEELVLEQAGATCGDEGAGLACLHLHNQVIKETLRLHAPIHSMLRSVKRSIAIEGTPFTVPVDHALLAAPGVTSRMDEFFPEPMRWEPHRWDRTPTREHAHLSPAFARDAEKKEDYGFGLVGKGTASPYLPFGAGRHRCIGEQFAYTQLLTILKIIVCTFRLGCIDGAGECVVGTDYSSLFSRPLSPAIIRWERRDKGGDDLRAV